MPIKPENRDRYPDDWLDIRARILERATRLENDGDGWGPYSRITCECRGECGCHELKCTSEQYKPHPVTGSKVILTIAHLDHVPEHCEPENLRAMCQRCHLAYDADLHAQTRAVTRRAELEDAGQMSLF